MNDLLFALRGLSRTPVFSAAIVLSLALGVGVNTAVFGLVNSLLLRPLPVPEPDRLVTLSSDLALSHGLTTGLGWSRSTWLRMQERAALFDGALAWVSGDIPVEAHGATWLAEGLFTSGGFFSTLGIPARQGRVFTAADDVEGGGPNGPVAVISDRFWRSRLDRDPSAVGSLLRLGHGTVTVIGIAPPDFAGIELGRAFDVAVPLAIEPALRGEDSATGQPGQYLLTFMLRLKRGQSVASAEAALSTIQSDLLGSDGAPRFLEEPIRLAPAGNGADRHRLRWSYQRPLFIVLLATMFTLLVACASIANLMFSRAASRTRDMSVRLALGAAPTRLIRQPLSESAVLALAGVLLGLVLGWWASHAITAFLAGSRDIVVGSIFDWRVLGFAVLIAGATTLVSGLAPALVVLRSSPVEAMKSRDRSAGDARIGPSGLLVAVQVALSMVLVVATSLLVGTFGRLAGAPLGFDSDRILIADVEVPHADTSPGARMNLEERLFQAAANLPGVAAAAVSALTPLSDASNSLYAEQRDVVLRNAVTPGWFATYGIPVHSGRDFDRRDAMAGQPVAIVNDAYRRKFFPGRMPIGETVGDETIVGLVGDTVFSTVRAGMRPTVYTPIAQSAAGPPRTRTSLSVRPVSGRPIEIVGVVGSALQAVSPDATIAFRPLSDDVAASMAQERLLATLAGLFAALALILAGVGLYGLMSHLAARRRTEIGIRLALGSEPAGIVRLILRRAATVIAAGVIAGTAVSVWTAGIAGSLLYGVEPRDPAILSASAAVLVVVGLGAAWFPARQASKADPAETLRVG